MDTQHQYKHMWIVVAFVSMFALIIILWAIMLPSAFARIDAENQSAQKFWNQLSLRLRAVWLQSGGQVKGSRAEVAPYSQELLERLEGKVTGE